MFIKEDTAILLDDAPGKDGEERRHEGSDKTQDIERMSVDDIDVHDYPRLSLASIVSSRSSISG